MKISKITNYRKELILIACFIAGNIVSSWPSDIVDYAERAENRALATELASSGTIAGTNS